MDKVDRGGQALRQCWRKVDSMVEGLVLEYLLYAQNLIINIIIIFNLNVNNVYWFILLLLSKEKLKNYSKSDKIGAIVVAQW